METKFIDDSKLSMEAGSARGRGTAMKGRNSRGFCHKPRFAAFAVKKLSPHLRVALAGVGVRSVIAPL